MPSRQVTPAQTSFASDNTIVALGRLSPQYHHHYYGCSRRSSSASVWQSQRVRFFIGISVATICSGHLRDPDAGAIGLPKAQST